MEKDVEKSQLNWGVAFGAREVGSDEDDEVKRGETVRISFRERRAL